MFVLPQLEHFTVVALRKESVDRNLRVVFFRLYAEGSLSARRAWIEIDTLQITVTGIAVALRKESVDRNAPPVLPSGPGIGVALRKESVDRNIKGSPYLQIGRVALRKESVDRN